MISTSLQINQRKKKVEMPSLHGNLLPGYVGKIECIFLGCVFLGESENRFVISDHSDHAASKEPTNPL